MKQLIWLLVAVTLAACASQPTATPETQEAPVTLTVSSTAFSHGTAIPVQYSCKDKGISPPLAWSGAPSGTESFALIMDDPDAPMGTFVHWVIYNIPSTSSSLPEAMSSKAKLPDGSVQGSNSAGRNGYTAPCPPSGTHRYFFKVYALDVSLVLPTAGKDELLKAMQGHILAQGELMGTFSK